MDDKLFSPNLKEANSLLLELLLEVRKWESTLSGGTSLGIGEDAVSSLYESRVYFGNPRDHLIRLTKKTLQDAGITLCEFYKQQMLKYDFYYMTLTINLRPGRSVKFRQLSCELDFSPKGTKEPIIQSLFPKHSWQSLMSLGAGLEIALDGNLNWNIGVNSLSLGESSKLIPGKINAEINNKSILNTHLSFQEHEYTLGKAQILVNGEGSSNCYWRIQDKNLQKIGVISLGIVFKVPKSIRNISLHGKVWVEPDMNWLSTDIRDILADLSTYLKEIIRRKNDSSINFCRGSLEKWDLNLKKLG